MLYRTAGVGTLRGLWVQSYVPKRPPEVGFQGALGQPEATVCDPSVFPVSEVLFEFPIEEMLYEIFESVLGLGGTSKQHFWGQRIKMLQNRGTKPREPLTNYSRSTIRESRRTNDRSNLRPWSKPSNQKTLHLEDGRE